MVRGGDRTACTFPMIGGDQGRADLTSVISEARRCRWRSGGRRRALLRRRLLVGDAGGGGSVRLITCVTIWCTKKINERVQKLRNEEEMREGEKGEAGVAEGVAGARVYRRRCSGRLELCTSGLVA